MDRHIHVGVPDLYGPSLTPDSGVVVLFDGDVVLRVELFPQEGLAFLLGHFIGWCCPGLSVERITAVLINRVACASHYYEEDGFGYCRCHECHVRIPLPGFLVVEFTGFLAAGSPSKADCGDQEHCGGAKSNQMYGHGKTLSH